LVHSKNVLNTVMQSLTAMVIVTFTWVLLGFSLSFGKGNMFIGIFIGSYIAARGAHEFKWRLPDIRTIRNSAVGGICMGFGASV
ncbi:YeeE/YedE thiosulfate transporter family protein, partial [Staphylococcus lugdunensis]|uniref:YeeE/YedE thiosulfate transporter family protein n=1 Tax=Staphylococcus lugdunensis TaxID=28035 RepID=UPI00209638C8